MAEFGIGSIGGGLEEAHNQLTKTEEVLVSIADQLGGIAKSLEGFEPVAKEMNKSKFIKSTKGLSGMFKSLGGASLKSSGMMLLLNTLKPLLDLFKPFQVILDLISALLKVMVGEALRPMFDALQPIYDAIIGLMPIFADLGATIGELIATLLIPLVDIFVALMPIIEVIIGVIIQLITMAIEPLKVIFDAIMPIIMTVIGIIVELITMAIEPLMDIFDSLMPVIMPIITMIMDLVLLALDPLMSIVKAIMPFFITLIEMAFIPLQIILGIVGPILESLTPVFGMLGDALELLEPILEPITNVLKMVSDGFIWFINIIIGSINLLMNAITLGLWEDIALIGQESAGVAPGAAGAAFLGGGIDMDALAASLEDLDIAGMFANMNGMQEGGIALSRGIFELAEGGEPEMVIPLTKFEKTMSEQNALLGIIHDELVVQSFYNRELVKAKEWEKAFI